MPYRQPKRRVLFLISQLGHSKRYVLKKSFSVSGKKYAVLQPVTNEGQTVKKDKSSTCWLTHRTLFQAPTRGFQAVPLASGHSGNFEHFLNVHTTQTHMILLPTKAISFLLFPDRLKSSAQVLSPLWSFPTPSRLPVDFFFTLLFCWGNWFPVLEHLTNHRLVSEFTSEPLKYLWGNWGPGLHHIYLWAVSSVE